LTSNTLLLLVAAVRVKATITMVAAGAVAQVDLEPRLAFPLQPESHTMWL
jgi:hypothetical protein